MLSATAQSMQKSPECSGFLHRIWAFCICCCYGDVSWRLRFVAFDDGLKCSSSCSSSSSWCHDNDNDDVAMPDRMQVLQVRQGLMARRDAWNGIKRLVLLLLKLLMLLKLLLIGCVVSATTSWFSGSSFFLSVLTCKQCVVFLIDAACCKFRRRYENT